MAAMFPERLAAIICQPVKTPGRDLAIYRARKMLGSRLVTSATASL